MKVCASTQLHFGQKPSRLPLQNPQPKRLAPTDLFPLLCALKTSRPFVSIPSFVDVCPQETSPACQRRTLSLAGFSQLPMRGNADVALQQDPGSSFSILERLLPVPTDILKPTW